MSRITSIGTFTAVLTRAFIFTLFCLSFSNSVLAETVNFNSAPSKKFGTTTLSGSLYKPGEQGSFPAVVIAHGCDGREANDNRWAKRLRDWGYVSLVVDSFKPRRASNVCDNPRKVRPDTRAYDVYGAVAYLRTLPYVNPDKIGVIGFSHGGWTSLFVAQEYFPEKAKTDAVQAVVAYYPWCQQFKLKTTKTPLLILAGERDNWTPSDMCHKYVAEQKQDYKKNVTLKVYKNAHHAFDNSDINGTQRYAGHTIGYNSSAARRSINETKKFFEKHLKNN